MNDAATMILLALRGGPQHGYAIQQEIQSRTGARLGPGTLYGAIARLEEAGLIAPASDRSGERRRPYRLTPAGRKELSSRLDQLRTLQAWASEGATT